MSKSEKIPPLTEHQEQAGFISEVKHEYRLRPDFIEDLLYAAVNGFWVNLPPQRRNALLNKYRAEGWRTGIADLHYDQPRGRFSKLVIEMKRSDHAGNKDGGLTPEQVIYLAAMKPYAFVRVCYTADEALAAFREYMDLPVFGSTEVFTVEDILQAVEIEKPIYCNCVDPSPEGPVINPRCGKCGHRFLNNKW